MDKYKFVLADSRPSTVEPESLTGNDFSHATTDLKTRWRRSWVSCTVCITRSRHFELVDNPVVIIDDDSFWDPL